MLVIMRLCEICAPRLTRRQRSRDTSHMTAIARRGMWQQVWRETARDYKYGGARHVIRYDSYISIFPRTGLFL